MLERESTCRRAGERGEGKGKRNSSRLCVEHDLGLDLRTLNCLCHPHAPKICVCIILKNYRDIKRL